ncbi:MAG: alkyldihydroxyacetonephosphate synthase [Bradymonadia bacterium]|jgi:alkyldihydroxyacetonephosphate synthase
MQDSLQRGLRPSVLRLYDEFDTYISGARKAGQPVKEPGLVDRLQRYLVGRVDEAEVKGKALVAANALLGRSLGAPIAMNALANNVYKGCLLIAGVEEPTSDAADAHLADLEDAFAGLKPLGSAPGEHWFKHRMSVSYKMSPLISAGLFVDTMEVATSWENLENLYQSVRKGLRKHVFIMAHFSHAYPSGCSIYFTFAGFGATDEKCLRAYKATWETALQVVADAGAAVTHHHGVGIMKGVALANDHKGGDSLFAEIKAAYDPLGYLNPSKLWDVETQWP